MDPRASARVRGFGTSIFTEMSVSGRAARRGQSRPGIPRFRRARLRQRGGQGRDRRRPEPVRTLARDAPPAPGDCRRLGAPFRPRDRPQTEVTVTSGATEAIFDAIQAFAGPGDEVIAFEPFYDSYPASTVAGGRFVAGRYPSPARLVASIRTNSAAAFRPADAR